MCKCLMKVPDRKESDKMFDSSIKVSDVMLGKVLCYTSYLCELISMVSFHNFFYEEMTND